MLQTYFISLFNMSIIFPHENSLIFDEKNLVKGHPRWQQVNPPTLYDFPHNCIGWITINAIHHPVTSGSGFLISPSLVLTAAHNFALTKKQEKYLSFPLHSEITFTLIDANAENQIISKVKSMRISPEYQKIANQINFLLRERAQQIGIVRKNALKEQIIKLHQEEMKHDFALLQLQTEIIKNQYFELPKNVGSSPQPQLVVSGYVQDPHTGQYRHWTHFQSLASIRYKAVFYDIDTEKGQSGSPAYIKYGSKIILIGIHKGYYSQDNLNYCTIITNEIIIILEKWVLDMKNSLKDFYIQEQKQNHSQQINILKHQIIRINLQNKILKSEITISKNQLKIYTERAQQSDKQYENKIKDLNKQVLFRKTQNSNLSVASNKLRQSLTEKDVILNILNKQKQEKSLQLTKLKDQIHRSNTKLAQQTIKLAQQKQKRKKNKLEGSQLNEKEEMDKLKLQAARLLQIYNKMTGEINMKNQYVKKCSKIIEQKSIEIDQYKQNIKILVSQVALLSQKNNSLIKKVNKNEQKAIEPFKIEQQLSNTNPIKQDCFQNKEINNKDKTTIKFDHLNILKQGLSMQIQGRSYEQIVFQLDNIVNKDAITSLILKNNVALIKFRVNDSIIRKYIMQYQESKSSFIEMQTKIHLEYIIYNQAVTNLQFRKYIKMNLGYIELSRIVICKQIKLAQIISKFRFLCSFTLWIRHILWKDQCFDKLVTTLNNMKLENIQICINMEKKSYQLHDWTKILMANQVKKEYIEWGE